MARWAKVTVGVTVVVVIAATALLTMFRGELRAFTAADAAVAYDALREKLDVEHPGRGVADYPGNSVADVPKAYAMVVLAELERRRRKTEQPLDLVRTAGRWLLDHADENRNGLIGWGVPVAWDAYGDGSVNPKETEYTIATAIVVHALLDWLEADRDAPKEEVVSVIAAALQPYTDPALRSPAGLLPYSLEPSDRGYDTFNPAAYLAGQMQRFVRYSTGDLGSSLQLAADETMGVLLNNRQTDADGNWYWFYSIQEPVPNDLAHASYIIEGISAYSKNGGRLRNAFDEERIAGHLQSFLREDDKFLSAWPTFRTDIDYPARSYDIGYGLAAAVHMQRHLREEVAARVAGHLPSYRRVDGWYRKYVAAGGKRDGDELIVGEYQAYILFGLAAWAHGDRVP